MPGVGLRSRDEERRVARKVFAGEAMQKIMPHPHRGRTDSGERQVAF